MLQNEEHCILCVYQDLNENIYDFIIGIDMKKGGTAAETLAKTNAKAEVGSETISIKGGTAAETLAKGDGVVPGVPNVL